MRDSITEMAKFLHYIQNRTDNYLMTSIKDLVLRFTVDKIEAYTLASSLERKGYIKRGGNGAGFAYKAVK